VAVMPSSKGQPSLIRKYESTIVKSTYIDPTERSSSPATNSIVMPVATMPSKEICRATLNRLSGSRKFGVAIERITNIAIAAMAMPVSR
jgi:hypothetical protein